VLVAPRTVVQDVKEAGAAAEGPGRYETLPASRGVPALGSLRQPRSGPRFHVKLLRVKPGATLSLQMHHTARNTGGGCGDCAYHTGEECSCWRESVDLHPGSESGTASRTGQGPVEIIEVQSGPTWARDIVRFEDVYGRKGRTT